MNKNPIDLELHEFIQQSIYNECNCILVGEKHLASKNSLEALAEIAGVLRQIMHETGKKIIVLSESFAATSQKKPKPIPTKILQKNANDPSLLISDWQSAHILSKHGVEIFGLENHKTNPFQKCKTAKDIDKFLQSLDSELLEYHHQKDLESYLNGSCTEEEYIYHGIRKYMLSKYRNIIPNEEFSKYINSIDDNVICIVCIGSSHIPALWDENEDLLEPGMLERISFNKICTATFITKTNSSISGIYYPEPEGNHHYSAIDNVSRESILSIGDIVINEIKNHIHVLQSKKKNLDKIDKLTNLVDQLEDQRYVDGITFGIIVEEWEQDLRRDRFKNYITQNNKPISENYSSLFSKKKGFDATQQFIDEMKQQYDDYPLSTPANKMEVKSVEKGLM